MVKLYLNKIQEEEQVSEDSSVFIGVFSLESLPELYLLPDPIAQLDSHRSLNPNAKCTCEDSRLLAPLNHSESIPALNPDLLLPPFFVLHGTIVFHEMFLVPKR